MERIFKARQPKPIISRGRQCVNHKLEADNIQQLNNCANKIQACEQTARAWIRTKFKQQKKSEQTKKEATLITAMSFQQKANSA